MMHYNTELKKNKKKPFSSLIRFWSKCFTTIVEALAKTAWMSYMSPLLTLDCSESVMCHLVAALGVQTFEKWRPM